MVLTPAAFSAPLSCRDLFSDAVSRPSVPTSAVVTNVDLLLERIRKIEESVRDSSKYFSPVFWRAKTARIGLPGLDLPVHLGGSNFSAKQIAPIFEMMGRYSLNMRDMIGGAHARALLKSNKPEHLDIVKKVAQGKAYTAICITEPEAGSNMRAMQSTAKEVDGGFELTGEKLFNARLDSASHVIIMTRAAKQDSASTKLSAFILPTDYPGLKIKSIKAHGLYGNSFGGVSFDKLLVPKNYLIGNDGDGGKIFREHFLYWRLMQSAAAIGTGKGALEQAAQRLRERQAFGGPIGRFTHLQQALGEYTAKLYAASLLVAHGAELFDQGKYDEATAVIAMAKGEGVEWALEAADFAMKVFGAAGYSPDLSDLGQRVRDLQGLRIADGTTDIMRQQVVRSTYGDDFWSMSIGEQARTNANGKTQNTEDLPVSVFTKIRNLRTKDPKAIAVQSKYDDLVDDSGGGACPAVSVANLMQGIAILSKAKKTINLDQAIKSSYASNPELKKGRLSNRQVLDLIGEYQKKYFPDLKLSTRVDSQKSLWRKEDIANSKRWSDFDSTLLDEQAKELKMISYTVIEASGQVIGRHFVILKERIKNGQDDLIVVIDPNEPMKDYLYKVVRVELPDDEGSSFQLIRPGSPENAAQSFIVNSVFTVKLLP